MLDRVCGVTIRSLFFPFKRGEIIDNLRAIFGKHGTINETEGLSPRSTEFTLAQNLSAELPDPFVGVFKLPIISAVGVGPRLISPLLYSLG